MTRDEDVVVPQDYPSSVHVPNIHININNQPTMADTKSSIAPRTTIATTTNTKTTTSTCARPGCLVKGIPTKRCSRCRKANYCSATCQTEHWKAAHKNECKASLAVVCYDGRVLDAHMGRLLYTLPAFVDDCVVHARSGRMAWVASDPRDYKHQFVCIVDAHSGRNNVTVHASYDDYSIAIASWHDELLVHSNKGLQRYAWTTGKRLGSMVTPGGVNAFLVVAASLVGSQTDRLYGRIEKPPGIVVWESHPGGKPVVWSTSSLAKHIAPKTQLDTSFTWWLSSDGDLCIHDKRKGFLLVAPPRSAGPGASEPRADEWDVHRIVRAPTGSHDMLTDATSGWVAPSYEFGKGISFLNVQRQQPFDKDNKDAKWDGLHHTVSVRRVYTHELKPDDAWSDVSLDMQGYVSVSHKMFFMPLRCIGHRHRPTELDNANGNGNTKATAKVTRDVTCKWSKRQGGQEWMLDTTFPPIGTDDPDNPGDVVAVVVVDVGCGGVAL